MNRLLMTVTIVALSGFFLLNNTGPAVAGDEGAAGIVSSIEKAPVIADGDVSGQPTDFVINFTGSPDHDVPGRPLMAGVPSTG